MSQKTYLCAVSTIFSLVALFHLFVVFSGRQLSIGDFKLPLILNVIAFFVAAFLAYQGFANKKAA